MQFLLPVPANGRPRRLVQLLGGLFLYGFSTALLIEAGLGLDPWDVLHQGASRLTGVSIGRCTIAIGVLVLLLWIPLRQLPGLGTVANAVVIGIAMDASLAVLPEGGSMSTRVGLLAAGVGLNGLATGLYIGAGLGPGPRDGLMTGIASRGHSIRVVRTGLEVTVLVAGWALGGTVGIGTIVYALAIGPLAHAFIPRFTVGDAEPAGPPDAHASIV